MVATDIMVVMVMIIFFSNGRHHGLHGHDDHLDGQDGQDGQDGHLNLTFQATSVGQLSHFLQCTMRLSPLQSINRTIYQNVYLAPHFFPAKLFQLTNI